MVDAVEAAKKVAADAADAEEDMARKLTGLPKDRIGVNNAEGTGDAAANAVVGA